MRQLAGNFNAHLVSPRHKYLPTTTVLPINASIIHGSALDPVEYVFTASDLSTLLPTNRLGKYANDTHLLVPAINTFTVFFTFFLCYILVVCMLSI